MMIVSFLMSHGPETASASCNERERLWNSPIYVWWWWKSELIRRTERRKSFGETKHPISCRDWSRKKKEISYGLFKNSPGCFKFRSLTRWRLPCIIYDTVLITEFLSFLLGNRIFSLVWDGFLSHGRGCCRSARLSLTSLLPLFLCLRPNSSPILFLYPAPSRFVSYHSNVHISSLWAVLLPPSLLFSSFTQNLCRLKICISVLDFWFFSTASRLYVEQLAFCSFFHLSSASSISPSIFLGSFLSLYSTVGYLSSRPGLIDFTFTFCEAPTENPLALKSTPLVAWTASLTASALLAQNSPRHIERQM